MSVAMKSERGLLQSRQSKGIHEQNSYENQIE